MISKEQMFAPMLEACASFEPAWAEFVAESVSQDPLYHVAAGALAKHLLELLARDQTREFPAVFGVVEQWCREGDAYVRNATVIGLFESMQNLAGWSGRDASAFRNWMQPESKKWWDNLIRYWDGETTALDGL